MMDEVEENCSSNFQLDESSGKFAFVLGETRSLIPTTAAPAILSIPATSGASEHSFSAAGRVLEAMAESSESWHSRCYSVFAQCKGKGQ